MKRFSFVLHYSKNNRHMTDSHEESYENITAAKVRALSILKEAKRDGVDVIWIDVYEITAKHVASYQ